MKKLVILILVLLIPLISAVEVDMKTNFSQGETLIAEVLGNFLEPILQENVFFYREHVRVPVNYDVSKIGDNFYIYADLLGKNPGNYSLVIKNVRHVEFDKTTEEDITKNFSINENKADFSIEPGFATTNKDFFIEAKNLKNHDIEIKININKAPEKTSEGLFGWSEEQEEIENQSSIILQTGQKEKIKFSLNYFDLGLNKISLDSENTEYQVPVYVYQQEEKKKEKSFKIEPSETEISLPVNSKTSRTFYLYNTGGENLSDITFSFSGALKSYLNASPSKIENLEPESNIKINVSFFSEKEASVYGKLTATTDELNVSSDIFLTFLKNYTKEEIPEETSGVITTEKTCAEQGGTVCKDNENCDGEEGYAKDNVCCLGECIKEEGKSQTGRIIAIIIIIFIMVLIFWFYRRKYKKAKKPINLLKIAKGKK